MKTLEYPRDGILRFADFETDVKATMAYTGWPKATAKAAVRQWWAAKREKKREGAQTR